MSRQVESASSERRSYLRAIRHRRNLIIICKIAIIIAFLGMWQLGSTLGWINSFILSSPLRMMDSILSLAKDGELWYHIWVTTYEVVLGFLLGTTLGVLIAICLWAWPFARQVTEPYLVVLNSLPKIALGPVFIVWFGAGPTSIIAITIAISVVVTIMEVLNGFIHTDQASLTLLRSMGATKMGLLTKVVIPANIPTIVNSLKVSVGMSWVGVIVGEFLVSRAGLGYLVVYGSQVFKMDLVMGTVLILAIECTIMYLLVSLLEKRVKVEE